MGMTKPRYPLPDPEVLKNLEDRLRQRREQFAHIDDEIDEAYTKLMARLDQLQVPFRFRRN